MSMAVDPIAAAYARRIQRGAITLEDVPESKREAVAEILRQSEK